MLNKQGVLHPLLVCIINVANAYLYTNDSDDYPFKWDGESTEKKKGRVNRSAFFYFLSYIFLQFDTFRIYEVPYNLKRWELLNF